MINGHANGFAEDADDNAETELTFNGTTGDEEPTASTSFISGRTDVVFNVELEQQQYNTRVKCLLCGDEVEPSDLRQHVSLSHFDAPYRCANCPYANEDLDSLQDHCEQERHEPCTMTHIYSATLLDLVVEQTLAAASGTPLSKILNKLQPGAGTRYVQAHRAATLPPSVPPSDPAALNDSTATDTSETIEHIHSLALQHFNLLGNRKQGRPRTKPDYEYILPKRTKRGRPTQAEIEQRRLMVEYAKTLSEEIQQSPLNCSPLALEWSQVPSSAASSSDEQTDASLQTEGRHVMQQQQQGSSIWPDGGGDFKPMPTTNFDHSMTDEPIIAVVSGCNGTQLRAPDIEAQRIAALERALLPPRGKRGRPSRREAAMRQNEIRRIMIERGMPNPPAELSIPPDPYVQHDDPSTAVLQLPDGSLKWNKRGRRPRWFYEMEERHQNQLLSQTLPHNHHHLLHHQNGLDSSLNGNMSLPEDAMLGRKDGVGEGSREDLGLHEFMMKVEAQINNNHHHQQLNNDDDQQEQSALLTEDHAEGATLIDASASGAMLDSDGDRHNSADQSPPSQASIKLEDTEDDDALMDVQQCSLSTSTANAGFTAVQPAVY